MKQQCDKGEVKGLIRGISDSEIPIVFDKENNGSYALSGTSHQTSINQIAYGQTPPSERRRGIAKLCM